MAYSETQSTLALSVGVEYCDNSPYLGMADNTRWSFALNFDRADQMMVLLQKGELYFSEAPIGYDARISIVLGQSSVTIIVTDRDKAGAHALSPLQQGSLVSSPI